MSEWPVLDRQREYDNGWFSVGYDRVRRPDGRPADYYWIDPGGDVVAVVAVDGDHLVMVEQYRPKAGRRYVECPAGGVEGEESFEAAARRELREETGYRAGSVTLLQTYRPTDVGRFRRGIVLAEELEAGDPDPDDGEFVEVRRLPVEEAFEVARRDGAIGWTLTPLLVARADGHL